LRFSASPARLAAGAVVFSPLMIGYRLGLIASSRGRRIASNVAFRGKSAAAVRDTGRKYATGVVTELMPRTVKAVYENGVFRPLLRPEGIAPNRTIPGLRSS
jgi:hypothetical protein